MNRGLRFSLEDHEETLRLALEDGGSFRLYPRGSSMRPLLREGIDSVILEAPIQPFARGEILLVRTHTPTPAYLLHRVIAHNGATLILRGDNNLRNERLKDGWTALARVRTICREERRIPMGSPLLFLYRLCLPLHRLRLHLGQWRRGDGGWRTEGGQGQTMKNNKKQGQATRSNKEKQEQPTRNNKKQQ